MKTKEYKDLYDDSELLYLVSDNSDESREILYKKYEPVISYNAKKYSYYVEGKGLDYNDLYQEGLIGLITAIDNYKEQKNIKFSTFAFLCIQRKILSAVRNASRQKHSALNDYYSIDYVEDDTKSGLDNVLSNGEGGLEDLLVSKEDTIYFNKLLSERLTDFEKMVYELRINSFSYNEISAILDRTEKSIERALSRIRKKIKEILKEIN